MADEVNPFRALIDLLERAIDFLDELTEGLTDTKEESIDH